MLMKSAHVVRAWGRILSGRAPNLSIEITRECPLRCPGCYAYEDAHLGGSVTLRQLADQVGQFAAQFRSTRKARPATPRPPEMGSPREGAITT